MPSAHQGAGVNGLLKFPELLISWCCQDISGRGEEISKSGRNLTSYGQMSPALGLPKTEAQARPFVIWKRAPLGKWGPQSFSYLRIERTSGLVLEFQDTLVRPSALGIPDRSVDLCHLPTRTFTSLGERSSLSGSPPCNSWNVVFKYFLPLLLGRIVLWWFFSAFGDGQKQLHWLSETKALAEAKSYLGNSWA